MQSLNSVGAGTVLQAVHLYNYSNQYMLKVLHSSIMHVAKTNIVHFHQLFTTQPEKGLILVTGISMVLTVGMYVYIVSITSQRLLRVHLYCTKKPCVAASLIAWLT